MSFRLEPHTAAASNSKQARGLGSENDKKELFNGSSSKSRSPSDSKTGSIGAVQNDLAEAHNKLLERGEKINRLADKSAETARAADDFAKMAKILSENQKKSWFS
jgi:syntaxin-binding protein 5